MYFKVLCIAASLALLSAQHGHEHKHEPAHSSQHISKHDGHAQEVVIHEHRHDGHGHEKVIDYHTHPNYEFEYKVKDQYTGDIKEQKEHRDGDHVHGSYWLHEPDGSIRHVHYHSDKKSGFHAEVKHSTHHIVPEHHLQQLNHKIPIVSP